MFRNETVLVLGAGASFEFGFPTGKQLLGQIATILRGRGFADDKTGSLIEQAIAHFSVGDPMKIVRCRHAMDLISKNMPQAFSIDNFIHAHAANDYVTNFGKLAILIAIVAAENQCSFVTEDRNGRTTFAPQNVGDTWLPWLLKIIVGNVQVGAMDYVSKLSIINFNYDRCVEFYLQKALGQYFDLSEDAAERLMKTIRIFHPYGSIAPLSDPTMSSVPFGRSLVHSGLYNFVGNIKTFTEGQADIADLRAIRQTIESAQTLIFLGFAFHPLNMAILQPDGGCSAHVMATAFNESPQAQEEFVRRIKFLGQAGRHRINVVDMYNETCVQFMANNYQRLVSDTL